MNKFYCDLCGNEITPNKELTGGLMRRRETFPMIPVGPGPANQIVQKRILEEVWDLCEDCQKFLWNLAEKKKADFEKAKEILKP